MSASRKLRRNMSPPEAKLWLLLRGSPSGVRFRRQYAVGPYVADFYCPAARLIIEIDGMAHVMGNRPNLDVVRAEWLKNEGFELTRIPALEVLRDPTAVADALVRLCTRDRGSAPPPLSCAERSPSPPASPARRIYSADRPAPDQL